MEILKIGPILRYVIKLGNGPGRSCLTYNYWYDLKTDLRWPESWLDFINMILRRFRLVLVKQIEDDKVLGWKLQKWLAFLDRVHEQGRCEWCAPQKEIG